MTGSRPGRTGPAVSPKPTIQDVARAAGVGRQTVSNVLNGTGRVGEATRARVLEAVAALGYQPHLGARSMRTRRTRQVAYVLPRVQLQPNNLVMTEFLQSLAAASASRHYNMMIVVPDGDPRTDMRRLIASRSVDAFILSEVQPDDPRVALLAESGMPFACFGRTGPGLPQHWVDIDNHGATAAAVRHVLARGFARPVFVGYRSASSWDAARADGFRAGLGLGEPSAAPPGMLFVDETTAQRKIRSLIVSARPGAVITSSDRLAAAVYTVAAEQGLRIGRDLAVTGFDGSVAAGLLHPALTSVAIPVHDIARRVLDRALQQIGRGADQLPGEIVATRLRLGESTGHPAGRDAAPDASEQVRTASLPTVLESIDRLGYRPRPTPAALVHGAPRTVAVIVTHMTRPSAVVRVAGALAVLEEQGYDTIVCNVDGPAERDRHLRALLPTRRVDGALAISLPLSREQLAEFARAGMVLATVDTAAAGVPQTVIDDVAGGRLATEHLISLGHRRIGFVGDTASPRPRPAWASRHRGTGCGATGRPWPRPASAPVPAWSGAGTMARPWPPSSPPSCSSCRILRQRSSRHPTPRPWACWRRRTASAWPYRTSCRSSASTTLSRPPCSG